jgi:hypothetical protein
MLSALAVTMYVSPLESIEPHVVLPEE